MRLETTRIAPFGLVARTTRLGTDLREAPVAELRDLVREHGLLVLRGFTVPATADDFADACAAWGPVDEWPFGRALELVEHDAPADHIFDRSYVPMHWDGMYRLRIPEFQMFHWVRAPGRDQGGRTTFAHTALALRHAPPGARALWERVTATYRRKMAYYDSVTVAPIVARHPRRGTEVLRYNEPPHAGDASFVNRPELAFEGVPAERVAELHRTLREALYGPGSFYAHPWETGDVVIADNYTLLHGREAFTHGAPRHLRRVHVLGDPPLDNPGLVSHQ